MNEIIQKAWKHFRNMGSDKACKDFIVKTMPILYFGNLDAYKKSALKVMTVGLNPSNKEFTEDKNDKNYRFFRFNAADSLNNYINNELSKNDIEMYSTALNSYFKTDVNSKPYRKWFDKNEPLLNGMKASYYNKQDCRYEAIHTDICTPIATDPTWGGLNNDTKKKIFREGIDIWCDLLENLEPDVVLLSAGDYLKNNKVYKNKIKAFSFLDEERIVEIKAFEEYKYSVPNKKGEIKQYKTPYTIELHRYKLKSGKITNIVYGNSMNGYFATVGDRKYELGEKIYNHCKIYNII